MCGIAGIVKWESHAPPIDPADLAAAANALALRGPDGVGTWIDSRPHHSAALVHRRLAVIDLPCGHQPMTNETRDVWVSFNGEIYNHMELRRELQRAGHTFATDHSDTEVLVHGWEEWDEELPKKLLGMFAFAIWDTRHDADVLFLARDRMGQKPLFYATLEDGLIFGSSIPSVLAFKEVPRRIPFDQIGLYFLLGYFPSPQTMYRDISQVPPGGFLLLRKDVLRGGVYWAPSDRADAAAPSDGAWPAVLRNSIERAVQSQLVSDVPIACFLSGGIDSTIIASLMQKARLAAGGDPITTVSVGFAEEAFDESRYAEISALNIGSKHVRLRADPSQNLLETLRLLMRMSLGQPFADSSILPTYVLSKAVREIAPVALSGDGADELFGGYDRYRAMLLMNRARGLAALARFAPIGLLPSRKRERALRFKAAMTASIPSEQYTRLVEIFPLELAEKLLQQGIMDYFPLPEEYGLDDDCSPLQLAMRRDQAEYLPGDVLWKVDSASMAVALEVRSPFLDHHVVSLANTLRTDQLFHGKTGKALLRQTFAQELPAQIGARGKQGFGLPIGEWFKTSLRNDLTDILFSPGSFTSQYLHKATAQQLLTEHLGGARDHTHRLFALLMLELWFTVFTPTMEPRGAS